nr:unnamed protein product [Callosobruchus analis]
MFINFRYSYEQINQVAKFLRLVVPDFKPLVGIICGSGLGPLADKLQDKVEVPYEDIPLFPTSTVAGHGGKLVFGTVGDVPVVCMKGRFHAYEGYPLWKVVMPVRVMRLLGAEYLIVTNAAGGIPSNYNVGDMMIIKDHVNFMGMGGQNPLRGPNIDEFGPRFPAMNKTYDRALVKTGLKLAESLGMKDITHEGVYACVGGPNYETIAELLMMQTCGIGSVGMSTAHEVIAAAHLGMKVFAFSLITNKAILEYDSTEIPNHEEVIAAAKASEAKLQSFTEAMIKHMGSAGIGMYSYEQINQVAKFLRLVVPDFKPLVGIICGSGLEKVPLSLYDFPGPLADKLQDKVEVPYEDIPLFPTSTVAGHGGKLVFGTVGDVPVVCMKGRFHAYEGYPLWKVVMPVRVMRLLGAEYLIVTNAAGGIPSNYNVGDMMIIKDHVNFMGMGGQNPLRGPNIDEFGPRFPAMNKTYDRALVKTGLKLAENLGMKDITHEGVYACVGGPNYETIAELLMMQTCGIGSVGMSTAHEVIAAAHLGMKVFAFSLITNKAILEYDSTEIPNHEEVIAAAKASEAKLQSFTEAMIRHMGSAGIGMYSYDQIVQIAKFLKSVTQDFKPLVGVICGSGLDKVEVPYEDIPLFPTSTVAGHAGKLVFGTVGDVPVVCMKGRFHAYEGYPLWKVVMPVRVMRLLGAEYLIVTNAAGGIPNDYKVGDMMIIKDHVNFMGMGGQNPLRGPNIDEFGPRFPAVNKTYDRGLVKAGLKIAESLGMKDSTHEGVYCCIGGPNYETIAEYALMKTCGIDAVGMSTAHEVITAAHCDMKVFAFSLISDSAIFDYDSSEAPNHEAVMAAVKASEEKLKKFTEAMIKHMGSVGVDTLTISLNKLPNSCKKLYQILPQKSPGGQSSRQSGSAIRRHPPVPYEHSGGSWRQAGVRKGGRRASGVHEGQISRIRRVPAMEGGHAGINDSYNVGDMMIIKDHVNLMGMAGQNPLKGPNADELGPRFPAMNKAYDREFVKAGRKIAENLGMADITREGVFAFSLISNKAIMDYDCQDVPNHEEVMAAAKANEDKLKTFTENMVKYMGGQLSLDCGASGEGAAPTKAEEATQAAAAPGICPSAIIQPCPCVSSAQFPPPPQALPEAEAPADDSGPAGEAPQEAPAKRATKEEGVEEEAKEPEEEPKEPEEAAEEEPKEPEEAAEEVPAEVEPIGEAPETPAVTEEPIEAVGVALPETEPDKDVAVGPEEPQSQDYQSQTVEDRGEQTETSAEEVEPIQEVGIQIEESTVEDGVAIQTLPETAEAKVGIEEPIGEEAAAEEITVSVETSTEAPAEAPTETPTEEHVEAPSEAPVEAPTEAIETSEEPVEAPAETPEAAGEEAAAETEVAAEAEAVEPPSEAAEAAEPVKEEAPRPVVVCGAAVKVECKSFAKCILREANVGPDTPIQLAEPPVEEANVGPDTPIEEGAQKPAPVKLEDPCIAPCKKFAVRKKGDRCPTTCPSKKDAGGGEAPEVPKEEGAKEEVRESEEEPKEL